MGGFGYSALRPRNERSSFQAKFSFPIVGYVAFVVVLILFAFLTQIDDDASVNVDEGGNRRIIPAAAGHMMGSYGMMMDATAMCVLGFGFLYAFCRRYTWGGITFNFLICGLCFIWCHVCTAIVTSIAEKHLAKAPVNIASMISADLVTAAVLITFGVVYGFVSPSQLLVICLIEPLIMRVNEHIVVEVLHVADAGGSILTHAFGAIYGIGVSLGLGVKSKDIKDDNRVTVYHSDTFAMLGSIVLWMFWPSFNGALLFDDVSVQQRVVVNTYLAICASCVVAMVTSSLVNGGKLSMLEVQNATLAGGVSIGMSCSFNVAPWVPVLIGGLAGALSSVGYRHIAGCIENMKIVDSAGANQLHGIPGIFGALVAGILVLTGNNNHLFSYSTQWTNVSDSARSNGAQFGFILAAIGCTVAIGFIAGALNGLLIRLPFCDKVPEYIVEDDYFEMDELYKGDGANGNAHALKEEGC